MITCSIKSQYSISDIFVKFKDLHSDRSCKSDLGFFHINRILGKKVLFNMFLQFFSLSLISIWVLFNVHFVHGHIFRCPSMLDKLIFVSKMMKIIWEASKICQVPMGTNYSCKTEPIMHSQNIFFPQCRPGKSFKSESEFYNVLKKRNMCIKCWCGKMEYSNLDCISSNHRP